MKILVTVSEAVAVDEDFEITGVEIDERYLTYDINEWDDSAIEEAVRISESTDDVEVVTVTVGPERTEEVVRQALANGADRAVRVWDDALTDTVMLDPATKADLVAAVAREEEPDLVLTGVQSGDYAFGATGVALAAELGYEWAAVVNTLELDEGTARVHRELEGGVEELTDVALPAVLTIQTGINDPRGASPRGIRQAQNKPLEVKTLEDAGLTVEELPLSLTLTSLSEPEAEGETTLFEGDANETADQLATLLRGTESGA